MNSRYRYRLYILTLLILLGTGVLLSRLFNMQIEKQEFYKQKVPTHSTVTVREPGVRGEIMDRHGIKLATNSQSYIVYFNLDEVRKAYVEKHGSSLYRKELVNRKGAKTVVKRVDLPGMVNELITPQLAKFNLDAKYSAKAMDGHYLTHGGLVPFVYRKNLPYDEFAILAEQSIDLPGVYISSSPHREYPLGASCSHILGFIKTWKKGDIPKGFLHYIGDPYGEDGIEKEMNDVLTGRQGIKEILKNEKGKTIGMVDYQPPAQGSNVYLTIDTEIQQLTETVLLNAGKAAAVVLDCRTGEVLAMASVPNYDPNDFIPAITEKRYAVYRENTAVPLMNRAISNFAPGSTFKLPAAIAAAKYGLDGMSCHCPGYTEYGSIKIKCHNHSGHGTLKLHKAIQLSCNPYFMKICNILKYKKMVEVYTMLGLGKQTGIELPRENAGIVPGNQRWKDQNKGKTMTPAFTGMMGIGQGFCQATPLQIAAVVSTIANGGKHYTPRIISKVHNSLTGTTTTHQSKVISLKEEGINLKYLANIREGMKLAADAGTARRAKPKDIEIGAKTGTAQTTDQGIKTHVAWTAAFAPYDNPRYVVVVAVKRGGSGGKVAGPIVRTIIQGLMDKEAGKRYRIAKSEPYSGHQKLIEEITIGEDNPFAAMIIDDGETGNEAEALGVTTDTANPTMDAPKPSIAPVADQRGSQQEPTNSQPNTP